MSKNLSVKYYQETKKDYKKSLWKIRKEKKQQYGHECYKNLSEKEKKKLVEYRKKFYKMRKNALS